MLCNALTEPYFDYACSAWCPNLSEKKRKCNLLKISVSVFASNWTKDIIYPAKSFNQLTGCMSI